MAAKPETNKIRTALDEALQDIQSVKQTLKDAYTPEATRAELVSAVSETLETLEQYDDEDEGRDGDED